MRRSLLIAFIMGTTALTPVRAEAMPPVFAFVSGLVTGLSGVVIGAAASAAFTVGASVGAFLTTGFGQLILGLGFAFISQALVPTQQVTSPSDRMVNYARPISYMTTAYGRVRDGGTMALSTFRNSRRHYAVVLAGHQIEGVVEHYLDDQQVEIDDDGLVITPPFGTPEVEIVIPSPQIIPASSYGSIRTYNAESGQTADPILLAGVPEWTSAHNFEGLSYAALYARRPPDEDFSKVYTTGDIWNYSPVFLGKNTIYDPRDDTTKYTNNAALVIADQIVNWLGGEVDWGDVAAEADYCDTTRVNGDGGTQATWTINVIFPDDQDWDARREIMLMACDGFMFERPDGKIGFRVGRWIEPDVVLTDSDFLTIEISDGLDLGVATHYVTEYVEPARLYVETPTGAFIADPEGRRVVDTRSGPGIDNYDQAVRISARRAAVQRTPIRIAGTVGLIGLDLVGKRFARVELSELGRSFYVEIGRLRMGEELFTFDLEAVATSEADHVFDSAIQTPPRPTYAEPESEDAIAEVTGLTGTVAAPGAILYEWDTQDASLTQQLRLRAPLHGQPNWQVISVVSGQSSLLVTGLTDGGVYEAQVQNRTSSGRLGLWKPDTPVSVTALTNSVPPASLDAFAAAKVGADAEITLTSPNDPNYYATRILRADYAPGFAGTPDIDDASVVRTEYGLPGQSDTWIDISLGVGVHVYWGRPINVSGVAGTYSTPQSIEIT